MIDREKVIKGLEHCLEIEGDGSCVGCPYDDDCFVENVECGEPMMRDALALLKEQEPRVLSLEEVLALNPDTPIYFQHKSGESGWDIYRGIEDDITCDIATGALWAQGDYWYQNEYGKSFVCWTSRPTDEQMEVTPWLNLTR